MRVFLSVLFVAGVLFALAVAPVMAQEPTTAPGQTEATRQYLPLIVDDSGEEGDGKSTILQSQLQAWDTIWDYLANPQSPKYRWHGGQEVWYKEYYVFGIHVGWEVRLRRSDEWRWTVVWAFDPEGPAQMPVSE